MINRIVSLLYFFITQRNMLLETYMNDDGNSIGIEWISNVCDVAPIILEKFCKIS